MKRLPYNSLQLREIFHLEFLRWLTRKITPKHYAVKGGVNMRFFFNSFRYSEDMDLDVSGIKVDILKQAVMNILHSPSFQDTFKPFGVDRIEPPDIVRAKQAETTQRFKVHLLTAGGDDISTKVEFSRRGGKGTILVEPISDRVLRPYKLPPLLVAHYNIQSAILQKIGALATRASIQARDIFDLYVLSSQFDATQAEVARPPAARLRKAYDNVFEVGYEQFRDTVCSYLSPEDQAVYDSPSSWDETKLRTARLIEEMRQRYA